MTVTEPTAQEFAETIPQALIDGDLDTIFANIMPVNVPDNWQEMVTPLFNDMQGRPLQGEVMPRDSYTNEELHWPPQEPPALADVEHILQVSYEEGDHSGQWTFPMKFDDGAWHLVLAQ